MKRWAAILLILLSPALKAQDWAPISPDVWSVKEDAKTGAQGAVILNSETRYGVKDTEFRMRILIFSEAGKAAAQLEPFPENLYKIEGRTVYPDRPETVFSKAKDFSEQTLQVGSYESKQKVVVPPGLTSHCIVDLHWIVSGTYLWGTRFQRDVQCDFPTRRLVLKLSRRSPLGSVLLVPSSMKPVISDDSDYRIYTFSDLPALDPEPFIRKGMRSIPCLICFMQPRGLYGSLEGSPEAYWNKATDLYMKPTYTELATGWKYKPFAAEILKDLPKDPLQGVSTILERLNARILNLNWMTAAERSARSKSDDKEYIHDQELSEAVKRGWTNSNGMYYLAYQLIKDAGIHPKLLLVADRDKWTFRYTLKDFFQFDDTLIGIPTADGKSTAWIDPANRFLHLGIIRPAFQGVPALEVDPDTWTAKPYMMPSQPKSANRSIYRYDLKVDEDSEQFSMSSEMKGYPEYAARYDFYAMNAEDAAKKLKEDTLNALPGFTITKAVVKNAPDRALPVSWQIEGAKENDGGRRVQFNPFPGVERPLWVPATWLDQRADGIVMPYCFTWEAHAKVHIPKGWAAAPQQPIQVSNGFGSVSWSCVKVDGADGPELDVDYEVSVDAMFGASREVDKLKALLSAVQEGWTRTLTVEHPR
jgi:hypothetical protein